MFDGSEQFHQFIASSRASLPISLPFPTLPSFDPYAPPLHHPSSAKKYPLISTNLALESDPSTADPWSNDELLALLKLRSTMEIWFPDFTWEHVSRKLEELGFKRSGDECKEKFEEESCRHFNNTKSYRILSELDEFYPHDEIPPRQSQEFEAETRKNDDDVVISRNTAEAAEEEGAEEEENNKNNKNKSKSSSSKRKRRDKLETFKGFCEAVVSKMMAKQEELHEKLMGDIVRREEAKIAREEAWRSREMDRVRHELEARTKEQKAAAERQATIIDFLKHFTSASRSSDNVSNSNVSNSSASFHPAPPAAGRRWPRDEVQALIQLRCKTGSGGGGGGGEEEGGKGPLWERISKGMMEMGYKRSAKRCKEKWENINKYFRKTKDSSKKRSVNSRTCPYFHQLSCLYSDGTIVGPNRSDAEIN